MTPQEAARLLGGRARGNRVSCPGPGHSKGDQSLTVVFTADGFIVHTFSSSDTWKECKDYVRTKLGIADDWKPDPAKFKQSEDPDERNFEFAMEIWDKSHPAGDTIVAKYLAGRSIPLTEEISAIRYHPRLKYDGSFYPSMVCIYRNILTNEPCGVQRTFLRKDATKVDRRMLGPSAGAAIKIDDDDAITTSITVGEGLESCLSGRRLGFSPSWALMSSQGVTDFPVLNGVETITFLGERDNRRQNEFACKAAARRWIGQSREVNIHFPRIGKDMNDAIRAIGNG